MSDRWPVGVRVVESPDGSLRCSMPFAPLGTRLWGAFFILSAFVALFLSIWFTLRDVAGLYPLPAILPSLLLLVVGVDCAFGYGELKLTRAEIAFRKGWLSRRVPTSALSRFVVASDYEEADNELLAVFKDRAPLLLANGLTKPRLWAVAVALADHVRKLLPDAVIEVEDEVTGYEPERSRQPARSRVTIVETADAKILTIPAAGVDPGRIAVLLRDLGFLLATLGLTTLGLFGLLRLIPVTDRVGWQIVLWAALLPMTMIEFALAYLSIRYFITWLNQTRGNLRLTASAQQLTIEDTGLFRSKKRQWLRDELAEVEVLHGWKQKPQVNDKFDPTRNYVAILWIKPVKGGEVFLWRRYGLARGHEHADWEWVGYEVKRIMGI